MDTGTADVWTIEVGSTITKVNGFALRDGVFASVAQGFAPTTVEQGDVSLGVRAALAALVPTVPGAATPAADLAGSMNPDSTFLNSSAAGGLRMTVHGLTLSMTARAAREASLGAGAIVEMVTAGPLTPSDLEEIREISPTIVLLAGGVDHGETSVVLENARKLAALGLRVPHVYAGNTAIRRQVTRIFEAADLELLVCANVFPEVDVLNVHPLRRLIHHVFNDTIIHAPGMARVAELTAHETLPTPGAVLRGAELFAEALGDVLVLDVGGATTDVHSVTEGSLEYERLLIDPEPRAKRTVEGDLGVYVNARNILAAVGDPEWEARVDAIEALPATEQGRAMTTWLREKAVEIGVRRHAGRVTDIFGPSGKKQVVRGKDLSAVRWVVATGGALTRVPGGEATLRRICTGPGAYLLPEPTAHVLIDANYLFSALGTLAQSYPDEVRETFRRWALAVVPDAVPHPLTPPDHGSDHA